MPSSAPSAKPETPPHEPPHPDFLLAGDPPASRSLPTRPLPLSPVQADIDTPTTAHLPRSSTSLFTPHRVQPHLRIGNDCRSRGSDRAFVGLMHVRDGSISSGNSGRFTPHRDVKTTRGGDSHFDSPAIHTAPNLHPPRFLRLAASRPGRQLPNGPLWPWPERPPAPRAWCGIEASVYSHPRPCLPEVAPGQQSHAGRRKTSRNRRVPVLVGDAGHPDGQPVAQHVRRRREAALDTLPGRIAGAVATRRGRGQGCASTPGSEPVPGPRTGGSLPAPPERPDRPWPVGVRRRKTFARGSFRSPAGAPRRSAEVRIGPPRRLRARVRP